MLDGSRHALVTPAVPKSAGSREWHGRLARGTHAHDARDLKKSAGSVAICAV